MKVFVVGGTGLFGYHSINKFLQEDIEVKTIALPPLPIEDLYDEDKVEIELNNLWEFNDEKIIKKLEGSDWLLYTAGKDERYLPDKPAIYFYRHFNVEPLKRLLPLAKKAGIKKVVVLGTYYTYFDRIWPKMHLAENHPYILSRKEQEQVVLSYNEEGFETIVLEVPFVFGTVPGKPSRWYSLIKEIDSMDPVVYTKGGTTMITSHQLADAVYGAFQRGKGGKIYPLSGTNMEWSTLIDMIIQVAVTPKKVHIVPSFMIKKKKQLLLLEQNEKKKECGLHPVKYIDFQAKKAYIDKKNVMEELDYRDDDVKEAVEQTIRKCIEEMRENNEKNNREL